MENNGGAPAAGVSGADRFEGVRDEESEFK